jgi:HEAT repeats/WD domain, G-beta repeat
LAPAPGDEKLGGCDRTIYPGEYAMNRPRGRLALIIFLWIVPAGWSIGRVHLAGPAAEPSRSEADDDPGVIQGKTIEEWIAALKDRDPAKRKRAVEVIGERSVDPDIPADEKSRLRTALTSVFSDKAPEVRKAAAFFAGLFKVSGHPEMLERLLEEHRRAVDPTRRLIRLVDTRGRPVEGAVVSTYFSRDLDEESSFTPPEPMEAARSNARGLVALKVEIPGHMDGEGLYAIRQDKGRPLVGLCRVTREELDKPIKIVMHPACRVLFRIESKGLPALEEKYHAELAGPGWWRAACVLLGGGAQRAPRPLFAGSTKGEFEFLLPPGRVTIHAYGGNVRSVERSIEIKPDDRELLLGTFEVLPSRDAEQGRFPDHHRVRRDPAAGGPEFVFRRIRYRPLRGMAREAADVAFSPDGKLLATAHAYNADPGDVKLWDMTTGAKVATLPVADRGIVSVVFSPDGKILAGRAYALADPQSSWEIILWDVASRRELRRFGGKAGRISAPAFAPDGRTLTTYGADRAVRLWDVATGREERRSNVPGSGWAVGFSRDCRNLVMTGADRVLILWDVAGSRLRATLEPPAERFAVYSVAFAPDGRTLAAAGATVDAKGVAQQGQVRLYGLTREPIARRAVLTFDRGFLFEPNQRVSMCGDVAFTPDGRRVVGAGMWMIRFWDVATGTEQDTFERDISGGSDCLAVSPDGRWLAVTSPLGVGVSILDITPPGR